MAPDGRGGLGFMANTNWASRGLAGPSGRGGLQKQLSRGLLLAGIFFCAGVIPAQAWQLGSNTTFKAGLTLKETYDDNVYILDTAPDPTITPPTGFTISKANQESFVTSVTPSLALDYRPCSAFAAKLSYAPDVVWYHSASSEDHVTHRGAINFGGRINDVTYESPNSITWIDGSDSTYITIRPGDCRCIGGIPLRDRRDAVIFKDGLKVTIPAGKWFFRPVFSAYIHDFQTKQFPNTNSSLFIYDNFVDRWEVNGGMDIGYEAFANTKLVVGYRYGHQQQGEYLGTPSPFCNDYQRFLLGIEGMPASWLKLAALAGPDVRDWCGKTVPGFDRDELLCYIDASATILPTKNDTIALRVTRYEQPAFTSPSVYEDIKYDLTWRHKFTDQFTAGAGFTAYLGDWQGPVDREDWIYTPSVMGSYAFNSHVTAEVSWSYDDAVSDVPNSPSAPYSKGREFTRNLVSLAIKYTF